MSLFLAYAITGNRLNGRGRTRYVTLDEDMVADTWNQPNGLPPHPDYPNDPRFQVINDVVMHQYGDNLNFRRLIPLRFDINGMKGTLFGNVLPSELDGF